MAREKVKWTELTQKRF